MAEINLNLLTVPTSQPYDSQNPQRNLENVCYCLLQVFELMRTDGFTLNDSLVSAVESLQFNQGRIDLGDVEILLTGKTLTLSET